MQPEQIMSSDLLDILFADRNKLYGAYPLRKGYNSRLTKALYITGVLVALALIGYYLPGEPKKYYNATVVIIDSLTLHKVKEPDPPLPPQAPKPLKPVATKQYTPYVIVPNDQVKHSPPPVAELNNVQI